jgi:hypothetical protein
MGALLGQVRRTLRISCEAVPPSISPAGAQGGTSGCHTGAALSFVSCIRLLGGPVRPDDIPFEKRSEGRRELRRPAESNKAQDLLVIDPNNRRVVAFPSIHVEGNWIVTAAGHSTEDQVASPDQKVPEVGIVSYGVSQATQVAAGRIGRELDLAHLRLLPEELQC